METKYNVFISDSAKDILRQHVRFLGKVSLPAAKRLSAAYRKSVKNLEQNPERFPFLELDGIPSRLYRKCLFFDRYELAFLIIDDSVYVDAVRDCRQDTQKLLS